MRRIGTLFSLNDDQIPTLIQRQNEVYSHGDECLCLNEDDTEGDIANYRYY